MTDAEIEASKEWERQQAERDERENKLLARIAELERQIREDTNDLVRLDTRLQAVRQAADRMAEALDKFVCKAEWNGDSIKAGEAFTAYRALAGALK